MLSKRFNDILFVLILIVAIGGVILMRFILLGNIDTRIESTVNDNNQIESRINTLQSLVSQHGEETLPSISELHMLAPEEYNRDQLSFYMMAQLEKAGISDVTSRQRSISISENVTFPQDSRFRQSSNYFDTYRIHIQFVSEDVDEVYNLINAMTETTQLFILQSVDYPIPNEGQPEIINIYFITFYRP